MSTNHCRDLLCQTEDLVLNSGVCALSEDRQIALFSLEQQGQTQVYATSNWDPIGKANVLSRGLLSCVSGEPCIVSPLYKQRYSLIDGRCLDDDSVSIDIFSLEHTSEGIYLAQPNTSL